MPRPEERAPLVKQMHDDLGHFGEHQTLAEIRRRYFWHNRTAHVKVAIRECQQCQIVATLAWARNHGKGNCKGVGQREARELSQNEARELNQKETRELRQEEAQELSQEEARESHHILPGVQESARECEGVNTHTPKATPTWGDGVSVDSRNFREQLQGSKLNGLWRSLYQ